MKTGIVPIRRCIFYALWLAMVDPVQALGVGAITGNSTLFQPLSAQIELNGATPADMGQLSVRFGSEDEYRQIGVQRPPQLSVISLSSGADSSGNPVIHLDSQYSLGVSVLGLLINVTTPRGRIQKFYNLVLNAPQRDVFDDTGGVFTASESAAAKRRYKTANSAVLAPAAGGNGVRQDKITGRDRLIAADLIRGDRYGPVRNGDNISSIAQRTRVDRSVTVNQMMMAYVRANSAAFERGNLSGLRRGAILRIPTSSEARQLSGAAATAGVSMHYANWKNGDKLPVDEIHLAANNDADRTAAASKPRVAPGNPHASIAKLEGTSVASVTQSVKSRVVTRAHIDNPAPGNPLGPGDMAKNTFVAAVAQPATLLLDTGPPLNGEQELEDRIAYAKNQLEEIRRLLGLKITQIATIEREIRSNDSTISDRRSSIASRAEKLRELEGQLSTL